jgi:MFS family permease
MIGIIIASFGSRPILQKLGRTLVVIGLGITLAGAIALWATVLAEGTAVSLWALAPSILMLGVGMGACFTTIYDVALGNIAPSEAGSASGSLSAVQQLATAIGSAVVTTVYFTQRTGHGRGTPWW